MISDGIAQLLDSVAGLDYKEASGGNVFVDQMPATPDRAVGVFTFPGSEPDSKLPYDPVRFRIEVRSEQGGAWAAATWSAIYSLLQGYGSAELPDGTWVVSIIAQQGSPTVLGEDENGRPRYSSLFRGEVLNPTARREAP